MSNVFTDSHPEPQVLRMAGERGWLRDYVTWAREQTSAAEEFHLGTGLGVLAATVGEKVDYYAWKRRWHPNLYVLLLGASGAKKSTALNLGKDIYEQATGKRTLPKSITSTSLYGAFEEHPSRLWAHSELAAFLSTLSNDYNRDLKTKLTDLYDGEELSDRTVTHGERRIKPTLSVLAASNAEWLTGNLKADDVAGGFLPRFTFFPGQTVGDEPLDWNEPPDERLYGGLIDDLRYIHGNVAGLANHSRVAGRINQMMAENRRYRDSLKVKDIRLSPFMERLDHLLIKLTVLLQVSLDGTLVITEESVEVAGQIVLWVRESLERMVLDQLTFSQFARGAHLIQDTLNGGMMTRAQLHRSVQSVLTTSEDLDKALRALQSRGQVREVWIKQENGGTELNYALTEEGV